MAPRVPAQLQANEKAFLEEVEQRLGAVIRAHVLLHLIGDPSVRTLNQLADDDRRVIRELVAKHSVDLPTTPP